MLKIIFLMALLGASVMAETVGFSEGKYIEVLDIYSYRDGNVTYDNGRTIVAYEDGKTIVKNENNVTVYDDENEVLTVIKLTERPEVALYFSLTKALFQKDFELLKENFEIQKIDERHFKFLPKGDARDLIKKMELSLTKEEKVDVLSLAFRNGDKIKIEAK